MSIYGIYDIDLLHSPSAVPVLEVMQLYRYLHDELNQMVEMISRRTNDFQKFSKVYYFKDNPAGQISKYALVNCDKEFYGEGFYGEAPRLPNEIAKLKPSYLAYAPFTSKLSQGGFTFESLQKTSLVRVETHNFADFKPDSKCIVLADNNPFYKPQMYDFLEEYQQYKISSLYTPLIKDRDTFDKFKKFYKCFYKRRIYLTYFYAPDDVLNNKNPSIRFLFKMNPNESMEMYNKRLLKLGLFLKHYDIKHSVMRIDQYNDDTELVMNWIKSPTTDSFFNFYGDNTKVSKLIINSPYRLLYKQNPKTFNCKNIDFFSDL